jgi:ABC-type Fe3+/spermidine/putrescine transport system ATPase subunit
VTGQDSKHLLVSVAGAPVRISCEGRSLPAGGDVTVGVRAENLRLGQRAAGCDVRFDAVLQTVMYRGTTTDHILELRAGQRLTATTTQLDDGVSSGRAVQVGTMAEDFMLLVDD